MLAAVIGNYVDYICTWCPTKSLTVYLSPIWGHWHDKLGEEYSPPTFLECSSRTKGNTISLLFLPNSPNLEVLTSL